MFAVSIAGALFFATADSDDGGSDAVATASAPEFTYRVGERRGAGTFSALARTAKRVPVIWSYRGHDAHLRTRVRLERFIVRDGAEIMRETLAEAAPASRFRPASGAFTHGGISTFDLRPGDVYGFRVSDAPGVTDLVPRGCRWSLT